MRWIQNFDLYLLDMDGLLVDTERLHFQAYQILCSENNQEIPWDFSEYLHVAHSSHNGLEQNLTELFKTKHWPTLYERKKEIYQNLLVESRVKLMPGVSSFLEELLITGKKRCVVTHSSKDQVEAIKANQPLLKTIPVWITREDYDRPKPFRDGYMKAFEMLADPSDRVIGFEDSLRGIQALKETFALPVLICDSSHPQRKSKKLAGTYYFSSFSKIPDSFVS